MIRLAVRLTYNARMVPDAPSWSARYLGGNTPWDHGGPHPELSRRIDAGELDPPQPLGRALVPGCGRGHDALALAGAGWRVTAVDFAPEAERACAAALTTLGGRFLCEDALAYADGEFDLIFEHTFFCAIDPADRARYGELAARSLKLGGELAALVFPVGKLAETGGPPWGITIEDLTAALGSAFVLREHVPVERAIAERSWSEHWALFERLG